MKTLKILFLISSIALSCDVLFIKMPNTNEASALTCIDQTIMYIAEISGNVTDYFCNNEASYPSYGIIVYGNSILCPIDSAVHNTYIGKVYKNKTIEYVVGNDLFDDSNNEIVCISHLKGNIITHVDPQTHAMCQEEIHGENIFLRLLKEK